MGVLRPARDEVKSWSFKRVEFDLPELPLDPPDSLVGERDWADSLYDSIWGGVHGFTGDKVGLVWPTGSITAERDPEQYAWAIEWLSALSAYRGEDDDRKKIVVLVPR